MSAVYGMLALQALSMGMSYSANKKAAAAAKAAGLEQRTLLNLQADELIARNDINTLVTTRKFDVLTAQQRVAFAGSGIDVGSSSVQETLNQTFYIQSREIANNTRAALFEAAMLRREGEIAAQFGTDKARIARAQGNADAINSAADIGITGAREYRRTGGKGIPPAKPKGET